MVTACVGGILITHWLVTKKKSDSNDTFGGDHDAVG